MLGWQARLRAACAFDKHLRPVEGAGGKFYPPTRTVFLFAGEDLLPDISAGLGDNLGRAAGCARCCKSVIQRYLNAQDHA